MYAILYRQWVEVESTVQMSNFLFSRLVEVNPNPFVGVSIEVIDGNVFGDLMILCHTGYSYHLAFPSHSYRVFYIQFCGVLKAGDESF
jgi:hypothetical protein